MSDTIEQRIIEVISETLRIDKSKITRDSQFIQDFGADSLDLVETVMSMEAAFGCDIPDGEAAKIVTVADAVKCVKQYISHDS